MRLSVWDLFVYLYKHKIMIALTVVVAFILSKFAVSKMQNYSAEIVISYKDACISNGYALDGSKFDSSEIVSPKVISNANKELPFNITDDGIKANTKIIPIVPDSEKRIQESKEKLGEEYEYHANSFRIRYRGNSSYYETRDTLDKLISNYFKYYNEKYLYQATVSEIDYNLNQSNYDYIEQAEILQNNIDSAIDVLQGYVGNDDYRSPSAGITFKDLIKEFEYLSEFKLPRIFSQILDARLSLDKGLLLNKYTERMESNRLSAKNNTEKAQLAKDRMDAYVQANVDVPNSYNSNINQGQDDVKIIEDIDHHTATAIAEQTTYDTLIKNHVTDSVAANDNTIDAAYCADIINTFSTNAAPAVDYAQTETYVKNEIQSTLDKLSELYDKAFVLIDDYNAYIPSQHIECLTGIRHYENVYGSFYSLVAIVLGFLFSCVLAIALEIMKKYAAYSKVKNDEESVKNASIIPDISDESIDE